MAEINGLLNRRTTLKLYRGFESLPHRNFENINCPLTAGIFVLKASSILNVEVSPDDECRDADRKRRHNE